MTIEEAEALAKKVIYDRLAVRAQSRSDLAQALAKKLVPEEVASAMLDKFEAAGLIDDEEFARAWVQSRQRSKGLSSRVLAMELRQKGVDDEITKEVLADIDPADELQAAHRLVQGKLRSLARFDDTVKIRRLTGMLARKGYSPQIAFDVVRQELGAEAAALDSL